MSKLLRDMTEPELGVLMKLVAGAIKARLPKGTLFALLVFDDPGLAQYIANCERDGVIRAMRECADRLETRQTIERVSSKPRGGDRP